MAEDRIALDDLPPSFEQTRDALHRLALHVVYRVRRDATGRYGLCWTPGGFGTPVFGDGEQVRVAGETLVHQSAGAVRTTPITTLEQVAEFLGRAVEPDFDHGFSDVVPAGEVGAPLALDAVAVEALGDFYGFADGVLRAVRSDALDRGADVSEITLWPEHFDIALDLAYGEPASERRVNVGGSPGDSGHPTPYLYVGPWTDERPGDGDYWNAGFGATLSHGEICDLGDARAQHEAAVAFVRTGLDRLRDG